MSKRNRDRPRTHQEQLESALVNHQLPMTDSTRPDESISTPEPMGIIERGGDGGDDKTTAGGEEGEVEWRPAYPCPVCFPLHGGVGIVNTSMKTVVYCRCNRCLHTWCAPRQMDAKPVNCVMMRRVLVGG